MNKKRKICIIIIAIIIMITLSNITYAHGGRTDSSGGHKDNKNASGLGSYHYHCGGHPAHLHDGGVCPYSAPTVSTSVVLEEPVQQKTNEPVEENKVEAVVGVKENSNTVENVVTDETTEDDTLAGIVGLGAIGGGVYWFKKRKSK